MVNIKGKNLTFLPFSKLILLLWFLLTFSFMKKSECTVVVETEHNRLFKKSNVYYFFAT